MSQKTIFIVLIAIILVVNQADSKRKRQSSDERHEKNILSKIPRVGCASFGHSCYGGFGKRSLTAPTDTIPQLESNGPGEHTGNLIPMKAFQRHFQFRPDLQQSDNYEQEKDLKIVVLNTLSQIIDETVKRISSDYESK
ncbi:uncharacterized protein CCHa2 isoform X1 [Chironomus tepperi]|uniref:uncharacterized protein CCHa2 isoform X1 n=1 Tax=Chironomus tepperi TaxID=113505 RepID=UPI00391FB446